MRSPITVITIFGSGLLSAVLTISLCGCGGNSATASHLSPPPPISVEVSTDLAMVQAGGTQQFTAIVANDSANRGVTWTVSCDTPPCGAVSPTSTASGAPTTYTAPPTPPPSDLYVTVTATSVAQRTAFAVNGTTVAAITVSVTPPSALVPAERAQPFSATVGNDPGDQAVSWTLKQGGTACSPGCGTLSLSTTLSGTPTSYSAPTTMPVSPSVTVTATSGTDAAKTATALITLTQGTVQLAPNSMDFGLVLVNIKASTQSATLTNTGTGVLNITSITLTGDNAGDFSQTSTCPSSLGAGLSCTITATFKPTKTDLRTATISITDSSADSPQQLSLSGTGKDAGPSKAAVRSALAGVGRVVAPIPTGPATVGTRVLRLADSAREDPFLAKGARRELLVRFWYPAVLTQACEQADYTSPKVWSYLSQLAGVHLPDVVTNSCVDAPMADGVHPIVVFTHGYTGTFTDYTFLFEDLASRGYVVASPAHTYETTAVEFPDGRLVKSKLGSYLGNSWRGDDVTLTFATSVRLQDLKFVLNELARLNAKAGDLFARKLDVSRIAIAGHSLGGTTAFLAAAEDARFRAAIILDGYVPAGLVHPTQMPVLLLTAGQGKGSAGHCRLWKNLGGSRAYVNLSDAEHLAPSDAVWLARGAIETGSTGPERTVAVVRERVAGFLDSNLREKSTDASFTTSRSDRSDTAATAEEQSPCREP